MTEQHNQGPAYQPPTAPIPGGVYGHPQPAPFGQPPAPPAPRKKKAPTWLIVVAAVLVGFCGIGTIATIATSGTDLDEPSTAAAPTTSADAEAAPAADKPEPPAQTEPEPEPEPELSLSQEQAIVSAQSYLTTVGGFSRSGLIDQLEYEGFSTADAEFAVDYLDVDWREQAVISAESYMENVGGFSRQGLIDQLEYEGFSTKNAEYAADQVGF